MFTNIVQTIRKSWNKNDDKNKQKQEDVIVQRVSTSFGKTVQKIYIKKKLIGKGAFAQCYVTENIETKKQYATKIIVKQQKNRPKLLNELLIHQLLHHDNIVDFSHAFEDKNNIYVFMQLCPNDTLEHLMRKKRLSDTKEIQTLFLQIIQGLTYIHSKNVIHRDLKPRNIFLGANNVVKIGDFGLAVKLQFQGQRKRNICGTPQYMPPQMIEEKGYGKEADIWALGILLYEMYTGKTPYADRSNQKIMDNIINLKYQINEKGIPKQALSLIKRILIKNPQLRPSLKDILESSFFGYKEDQSLNILFSPRKSHGYNLNFQTPKNNLSENLASFSLSKTPKNFKIPIISTHVTDLQQIGNDVVMYLLNNMCVGVLKKQCEILIQNSTSLIHILLQKNGKAVVNQNPKYIDNFLKTSLQYYKQKCKKYLKSQWDKKVENSTLLYVSKVTRYRNCFLIKLSNDSLQLRFSDRTNILINFKKNTHIEYIDSSKNVIKINMMELLKQAKNDYPDIDGQKISFTKKILRSILPKNENDLSTAQTRISQNQKSNQF